MMRSVYTVATVAMYSVAMLSESVPPFATHAHACAQREVSSLLLVAVPEVTDDADGADPKGPQPALGHTWHPIRG